jgi:hypothetical protein
VVLGASGEKMGRGAWRWERRGLGVGGSVSVHVMGAKRVGLAVVSVEKRNMAQRSRKCADHGAQDAPG